MTKKPALAGLNALPEAEFTAVLAELFEHSPWIAEAVAPARPFADIDALHAAMVAQMLAADPAKQLALLRAHPVLARPAALTQASAAEQDGHGLQSLDRNEAAEFAAANQQYQEKFGFPFIVAVRGQRDRAAILAALHRRLAQDAPTEQRAALAEIARIARFRLDDLLAPADASGRLSVHVLDTAAGAPAAGMGVALFLLEDDLRTKLGGWQTNKDGRCDAPLLQGADLRAGLYEIVFAVKAWRESGQGGPGFYDDIPIRFRVTDMAANYHVPLILAPFGYSTYRGS